MAWSANDSNVACAGRSSCIVYSSVAALAHGTCPSPVTANYTCFMQEPNQSVATGASAVVPPAGTRLGEELSTLAHNNFNDRGDSSVSPTAVYAYTLSNGYACALRGWTHTRAYAKGFLANSSTVMLATVSGLEPNASYMYAVYQFASALAVNGLAVNGVQLSDTTSRASAMPTATGLASASRAGSIEFAFTRRSSEVHLSGIGLARVAAVPRYTYSIAAREGGLCPC